MQKIEQEILLIKDRNKRVELDKAWETSWFRKIIICALTYVVMCLIMYSIGIKDFYINAIIPTVGFFLSTLSMGFFKKFWVAKIKKTNE